MSDSHDELMAIPRLAAQVGTTPRVLRYWEQQGLISPTKDHGKLRYSPRDLAIARLIKQLVDAGLGIDAIRMLKTIAEREVRYAADAADDALLCEAALRILYQRKAFREVTGTDEEHYPQGLPPPPPPPGQPHPGPPPHRPPRPRPPPP